MNAAVIRFPGSNREGDIARALSQASGRPTPIVWHDELSLPARTDLVVLPGGFSYGDYLRCGAIAARAKIMDAVRAHAARGGYVLGVCNGFQILCEAGLLPGVLMRNAGRSFVCRMQHLRIESDIGPFVKGYRKGEVIKVAIAHGEGNFVADEATIETLEKDGRVAYRYCDADGDVTRDNPNGSINAIAGISERKIQRPRHDAASREPDRQAGRRHGRTAAVRGARRLNVLRYRGRKVAANPFPPCGGRWREAPDEGLVRLGAMLVVRSPGIDLARKVDARCLAETTPHPSLLRNATFPRKGRRARTALPLLFESARNMPFSLRIGYGVHSPR